MKRLLAMIAALSSSQAAAQGFVCNEWSAPGYGEGGALVAIMTDDQLTWSNGTVWRQVKIGLSHAERA